MGAAEGYSTYDSIAYDLVKTRLLELQALCFSCFPHLYLLTPTLVGLALAIARKISKYNIDRCCKLTPTV